MLCSEMFVGRAKCPGTSCPLGEMSLGRVCHGASYLWGEMIMGRNVMGRNSMGRVIHGASFDRANCPGIGVYTGRSISNKQFYSLRKIMTIFNLLLTTSQLH
jgi:hypothetical protein